MSHDRATNPLDKGPRLAFAIARTSTIALALAILLLLLLAGALNVALVIATAFGTAVGVWLMGRPERRVAESFSRCLAWLGSPSGPASEFGM